MNDIQVGQFYLTDSGVKLQSNAQVGYPLIFTRCGISEQVVNSLDELTRLGKLEDEKGSFNIRDLKVNNDGTSSIIVEITNKDIHEGFLMRTIGVYAKDQTGAESLYCVSHNAVGATFLPPDTISQENILLEIKTVVGNASNLSIVINENSLYALDADVKDLAGAGRTKETVKENADKIGEMKLDISLIQAQLGINGGTGMISITFDDIEPEHVLDGVWDKAGKRLMI